MRAKAASTAVASPWATWQVGRPRRVFASSIEGRSSRMRLAVWTISMAQPAGSTASGLPFSTSATSSDRMGRSRLAGGEEAVRDRGLDRRGPPRRDEPAQRRLHLAGGGPRACARGRRTRASDAMARTRILPPVPRRPEGLPASRGLAINSELPMDYREAGVDISAADAAKARIKGAGQGHLQRLRS